MASSAAAAEAPAAPAPPTPIKQLKFDALAIEVVLVGLSGGLELNMANPRDSKIIDQLLLGKKVEFRVEGYVKASAGKAPRDAEGSIKSVRKVLSIEIDSILGEVVDLGRP